MMANLVTQVVWKTSNERQFKCKQDMIKHLLKVYCAQKKYSQCVTNLFNLTL